MKVLKEGDFVQFKYDGILGAGIVDEVYDEGYLVKLMFPFIDLDGVQWYEADDYMEINLEDVIA